MILNAAQGILFKHEIVLVLFPKNIYKVGCRPHLQTPPPYGLERLGGREMWQFKVLDIAVSRLVELQSHSCHFSTASNLIVEFVADV